MLTAVFLLFKNPPETVQKLTLVCEYLDADSWKRIDVPVQIVITDINDNAPKFLNTPYKTTVSEVRFFVGTSIIVLFFLEISLSLFS